MVDRVYKKDLPALRHSLEKLREDFSKLDAKTDWTKLRIDPLLRHVESLEHVLGAGEFSHELSRLRRGVLFFYSDLVYFRTNVKELTRMLRSLEKRSKRTGSRAKR